MKHWKNIKIIVYVAFALSMLGFMIDIGELDPNLFHNILDISMMTLIIFCLGLFIYFIVFFLKKMRIDKI